MRGRAVVIIRERVTSGRVASGGNVEESDRGQYSNSKGGVFERRLP